jgi:signal transduction histidine kinase
MRVLILDDDEVDRMSVRRALSASGLDAEVVEADSISAARSVLEHVSVDAIVSDYLLADGDAGDLLRELKRSEAPPLVVLTGQGDERVAVDLMKAGAADYLSKSALTPRRIRRVLRAALRIASAERRARVAQEAEHRMVVALERALSARDEVLAIVSHDLRSPLSNLSMALDILGEVELAPEERGRVSGMARRAVDRMERLISDLLDVARIEQGGLALELDDHDAAQLACDVVDGMRIAAERRGVELAVHAPGAHGVVRVDRARLSQVFQNLLGNALRFTPAGGTIRVHVEIEERAIRYRVHDDGPGVPEHVRPHLFERFWQAHRAERSSAGLGLAIVKGIVEAHGGQIALVPVERGACFVLTLPR